ncbi:MAG: ABC transporter permease [Propionibacteriaceae bacterium]|nr:ABC transporter permease [Propionibacteriaceae bacterium]
MSFIGRAWRYVCRKWVKTLIVFGILVAMMTALFTTSAISRAADRVGDDVAKRTGAGFVLQNNPQFNMGTPRGAGTVKGADIEKIAALDGVKTHVARQNVTADLGNAKVQKLPQQEYDAAKEKQFGNAANVWGVNATELDNNFRSGALKLAQGRHLSPDDHHKAVIHEDLAKANGLKLGSTITLKANPYDVDNQKKSTAQVDAEIVGLVSGKNTQPPAQRSELFANTLFTDLDTTRALYGWDKQSEIYQDANFFVQRANEVDRVAEAASKLNIDWRNYQLAPTTQYLAGITGAVDGVRGVMGGTTVATFVLAGALLLLVLCLWLNERKKETGVLLAVGTPKAGMVAQYLTELVMIAIPAMLASFFLARAVAQGVGSSVLSSVNASADQGFAPGQQAGADLESSAATQTLDALNVHVDPQLLLNVGLMSLAVLAACALLASVPMLRRSPRALMVTVA